MDQYELRETLLDLFAQHRKRIISPIFGIVLRDGSLIIGPGKEFEAGDIVIVPPSLVTGDAPSQGYILGCIDKVWPQIKETWV